MTQPHDPAPSAEATCEVAVHALPYNGGTLHARSWTPASASAATPPIVLLHDSLGAVSLWRSFPEALALATGRQVVAYDRAGFGESSPRVDTLTPSFVADEASTGLSAVVDRLGIERFVAMGHSVGGGMAIEAAAQLPGRVDRLITIAAQVFAEDRTLTGIRAAREDFKAPEQLDRLRRYHGVKAPWVLSAWTETWLSAAFADWSLCEVLTRVQCPTLTIHGGLDEFGSTIHQELIRDRVSGQARKLLLPENGHMPHREAPEVVLAEIRRFLA
ncbi:alpha/beta fold hydrolase [Roseateles chitosanitabidus]|uniref:alpha/beta fold hydrolase n=1 Tax=Roseateles chitosanitabidus TaxID=65048 RepID=UPI000835F487|nr:alpha/beta hydrolase [Roseateles chitosanitabidus]